MIRWKKAGWSAGFSMIVLLGSSGAVAYHDSVTPETINSITSILRSVDGKLATRGEEGCFTGLVRAAGIAPCGFVAQCQLLSENRNSPYIYKNSLGEKAINFKLLALRRELKTCLKSLGKDPDAPSAAKEIEADRRAAKVAFYKALAEKGEQAAFLKILQASAELALDAAANTSDAESLGNESALMAAEVHAGVSLSADTRSLYMKMLPREKTLQPSPAEATRKAAYYAELQAKAERVFERARKSIRLIVNSRQGPVNNAEIKNVLTRIDALKIEVGRLASDGGECSGPDAFFSPGVHKIVLCPEYAELPEFSLLEILAHEVAHSFDPCSLQGTFVHTGEGSADGQGYRTVLEALELPDGKTASGKIVQSGVPLTKNPFASALRCLATKESIHARVTGKDDMDRLAQELLTLRNLAKAKGAAQSAPAVLRVEKALEKLSTLAPDFLVCSRFPAALRSQIQESFSDWISTQVINEAIRAAPPDRRREMAIESTLSFSGDCLGFDPDSKRVFEELKTSVPACGSGNYAQVIKQAQSSIADEHPPSFLRVDRLFLAQPEIRRALGCEGNHSGVKKCE